MQLLPSCPRPAEPHLPGTRVFAAHGSHAQRWAERMGAFSLLHTRWERLMRQTVLSELPFIKCSSSPLVLLTVSRNKKSWEDWKKHRFWRQTVQFFVHPLFSHAALGKIPIHSVCFLIHKTEIQKNEKSICLEEIL